MGRGGSPWYGTKFPLQRRLNFIGKVSTWISLFILCMRHDLHIVGGVIDGGRGTVGSKIQSMSMS